MKNIYVNSIDILDEMNLFSKILILIESVVVTCITTQGNFNMI